MVALDPAPDVISSAIDSSCQLLVTHHPLLFKPLKSISRATRQGSLIHDAIRGGLSIACLHTNYDIAAGGLNDLLAGKIGLSNCLPLQITSAQELVKLVIFVPVDHIERVRSALFPFTEAIGNYRDCSFAAGGEGTFTPLDGAKPFIGVAGIAQRVPEERLELLLDRKNLSKTIKTLLAVHPYQEPAFDVYPLLNEGEKLGLGRIGHLSDTVTLAVFAGQLKKTLSVPTLRYVGEPSTPVSKVALCSGSGASLVHEAARAGADVLVTGDVKYHDARAAEEMGIALIDAGHFHTEIIMVPEITQQIKAALCAAGYNGCQVVSSPVERDPFTVL